MTLSKTSAMNIAQVLSESLPYIQRFTGTTIVVKYGGNAMTDEVLKRGFAKDVVLMKLVGMNPVVVHGGGPQIADKLKTKNITTQFIDGLRVTDIETVKVVEDVLGNEINSEIVKAISDSGGKAVGLTGNKNNLLTATKLKVEVKGSDSNIEKLVDIGFVGQPTDVNTNLIKEHINLGEIPVIAPLGIDAEGNSYNINADTAAGFIAGKLKASKLLLLTDVAGVLDKDKKLIPSLKIEDAMTIIKEDFVVGGMKPKIKTCIDAMKSGVTKSTILDGRIPHSLVLELFTEHGIGTQIYS